MRNQMHSSAMVEIQLRLSFVLLAIVAAVAGKPPPPPPPPPGAPWAKFVTKPVFTRSLGPPMMSGIGTITVPYAPKPSFFPKFVDPRIMIAKKTDMLNNLFGGVGPVVGPPYGYDSMPYSGYGSPVDTSAIKDTDFIGKSASYGYPGEKDFPLLYASAQFDSEGTDTSNKPYQEYETLTEDNNEGATSNMKRGIYGPSASKFPIGGTFGTKSSKFGSLYGSDGVADTKATSPFYKRGITGLKDQVGPPLPGAVESLIPTDKKTEYLDTLFKDTDSTMGKVQPDTSETQHLSPTYSGMKVIPEPSRISNIVPGPTSTDSVIDTSKNILKRMVTDDMSSPTQVSVPKQYMPGMFGPGGPMFGPGGPMFGPGGPMFGPAYPAYGPGGPMYGPSPMFGPSAFISKKSAFLDTLFKNLPATTAAPVTDTPVPKSTIVPPEFWLPDTMIPAPGAYTAKVSSFLDKLFDTLKLNASKMASDPMQETASEGAISAQYPASKINVARDLASSYGPGFDIGQKTSRSSVDPLMIVTAKDQIMSSIIDELTTLKDNMMSTFDELMEYHKNSTIPMAGTKPFKPFAPPFWGAKASVDATALMYKQRMITFGQVFDLLTELQKNVSEAINDATKTDFSEELPFTQVQTPTTAQPDSSIFNLSLLDAIQAKLDDLKSSTNKLTPTEFSVKKSRSLPIGPSSFWVANPGSAAEKRNAGGFAMEEQDEINSGKDARAIKMQMHQGYQSLPPGTIETVQAGGGSVPGHEGGGVKLLGIPDYQNYLKWQDWKKNVAQEYQRNHHQHNRH